MAFRLVLTVGVALVCGCSAGPQHPSIYTLVPDPALAALRPGERIRVEVRFRDLSQVLGQPFADTQTIDIGGDIKVLGGTVHVAGLTTQEAAGKINDYYAFKEAEWGRKPPEVSVSRF